MDFSARLIKLKDLIISPSCHLQCCLLFEGVPLTEHLEEEGWRKAVIGKQGYQLPLLGPVRESKNERQRQREVLSVGLSLEKVLPRRLQQNTWPLLNMPLLLVTMMGHPQTNEALHPELEVGRLPHILPRMTLKQNGGLSGRARKVTLMGRYCI